MPAVSVAIIRDGQLAWQRAFGVKDTGTNEPVDTDTVFAACSDTKPVFAYGVLKLCEKGVLSLDTPLTRYTKRRITTDPRIELVTARHVLNHTTGFPNWRQGNELPIEFDPGSRNQYSGEGFSYLQSVVEGITHKSFVDFMHDDVLKPLGMTASRVTFEEGTAYARLVARRHDQNGKRIPDNPVTPQERAEGIARYGAAAMLMTTPTDYAMFLREFLDPKPADTFRLNDASRAEMLRPQVKKTDTTWEGLAWHLEQIQGIPMLFSHAGEDAGYYCLTAGCTERRSGLMVMLNGDAYLPFLMKMLANPTGPPLAPQNVWPEFAKRFFGLVPNQHASLSTANPT
ncbi:MAG TPA: serine hydrolase domain-containing protein [Vicinamibacterales bacterium]|nr:serine hydrolase domain-containing protein [Vicinamibacterales bacterium]